MKRIFLTISIALAFGLSSNLIFAQTIPVGTPVLEDYYRRLQLNGGLDSTVSFSVRPLYPAKATKVHNVYDPDSTQQKDSWFKPTGPVSFAKGYGAFQILPLTMIQQYNSNHPYGWNDGLMIPAKGYQTMISGGFFFKIGPLSIQFRPEYVYAANPIFAGFASGHGDVDLTSYYNYHNHIDQPERFGNGTYTKASLGQSSIRLTFGPASIGLSNENLWWGPGIENALVMTNNAPGFKHLTLNTVRPIHTFIGSFEGQIIAARLDATGQSNLTVTTTSTGTNLYQPKLNDWRYYTGFNLSYQPRWVPGLFLGWIRTFNAYHSDIHGFSNYFPFLTPFQKADTHNADGDGFDRDQITSFYARWLFIKAKAEIYFEYGLNDNSYNYADFLGSPEHSRAYIFGLRKLIPLASHKDQGILFGAEIDQLSQSSDRIVRQASGWYIHSGVNDGQTNEGQILGAGTGSGGNLQTVNVSWVSGLKKLGVIFQRYEHDTDFAQIAFPDINGNSRNWVDFALGLQGDWGYKNLLFNAKLQGVKSLNYEWILKDYNPNNTYYIPHNDVFNLYAQLGVTFRF
ncbi:capsule assembly Wzi family protein [Mucilaginibacter jinjuensis]|uniref:Capsule assembly Wzi family protein n=1 Tax=Mucilaginibacter jinjuensis TaxID=1176721 RepID=A0ABY7T2C5_9SPHI|nr:capsule assembly Wzi family protein [Mucilaginibacter jinjuensis]WCT10605.1 capsule assembly Wzi family protein [Mucilaginibacter jinjuensis]